MSLTLVNKSNWPFDHSNHKLYISPKVRELKQLQTGFQTYYKSIYKGESVFQNVFTTCDIQFKISMEGSPDECIAPNNPKQEKVANELTIVEEERETGSKKIIEEKKNLNTEPKDLNKKSDFNKAKKSEKWRINLKVDVESASLLLYLTSEKSRSFDLILYQLQVKSEKLQQIIDKINSYANILFVDEKSEIQIKRKLTWGEVGKSKEQNRVRIDDLNKQIYIQKESDQLHKFTEEDKNLEAKIQKLKVERMSELQEKSKLEQKYFGL